MKKSHRLAGFLVVALLLGVTVGATATVGAADDTGPIEEALNSHDRSLGEFVSATYGWAKGQAAKAKYAIAHSRTPIIGGGEADTASDEFADVQSYYNDRSTEFEGWVNDRTPASTDHDVIEIEFQLEGETETGYLLANVSNGNYTETAIKTSTNRTVDETVTMCGYAADSARDELKTFYKEYVEPGNDVETGYLGGLAGRYKSHTATSFPIGGDETECDA